MGAEWALQGEPILRPMWYNGLADTAAYANVDNQFFVGEALVVCAVNSPGAKSIDVYLPPGTWYDFWSERATPRKGGSVFTETLHRSHVPVFVQQGRILMKKMRPRRSAEAMVGDPYSIV